MIARRRQIADADIDSDVTGNRNVPVADAYRLAVDRGFIVVGLRSAANVPVEVTANAVMIASVATSGLTGLRLRTIVSRSSRLRC